MLSCVQILSTTGISNKILERGSTSIELHSKDQQGLHQLMSVNRCWIEDQPKSDHSNQTRRSHFNKLPESCYRLCPDPQIKSRL